MYEAKQYKEITNRMIQNSNVNDMQQLLMKRNRKYFHTGMNAVRQFCNNVMIDNEKPNGCSMIKLYIIRKLNEKGYTFNSDESWTMVFQYLSENNNILFDDLLNFLDENGCLIRISLANNKHRKVVNPHTRSGPKELNVFSLDTKKAVPISMGQHRRHIIPRSVLWQAVQRAECNSEEGHQDVIDFLNKCSIETSNMNSCSLYETAYKILQNHPGNLWAGNGGENSAIGFFPTQLLNTMNSIIVDAEQDEILDNKIEVEKVIDFISEITATMGFIKGHFEYLKEMLIQLIKNEKSEDGFIDINVLLDLVDDFTINCEFDPSPDLGCMTQNYLDMLCQFSQSSNIFRDNLAYEFMNLNSGKSTEETNAIDNIMEELYDELPDIEPLLYAPTEAQIAVLSNFKIMNAQSDGACLFHAISMAYEKTEDEIKKMIFVKFEDPNFCRLLIECNIDPNFLASIIDNNNFGHPVYDLVPEIVAIALGITLHILQPEGNWIILNSRAKVNIYLIRYEHPTSHYDFLQMTTK